MKRCLACDARHASTLARCPRCGAAPPLVDGFPAHAPELAQDGGGGFKPAYFANLARSEEASFWFRARNRLIIWALKTYCPGFRSFLEIGCGTGYVLSGVAKAFPGAALHGSEIFTAGLRFAAARLPSAEFMQMDARHIPFEAEFEVIGAFDVLEHIAEDERVLAQAHAALKPGGFLLVSVPQHAWLWSAVDDYSCHVRRYGPAELRRKVRDAGFRVVRSTSFVTLTLPAMALSRFALRRASDEKIETMAQRNMPPWLNAAFYGLTRLELAAISHGLNLPLGGSRLVVAQKP